MDILGDISRAFYARTLLRLHRTQRLARRRATTTHRSNPLRVDEWQRLVHPGVSSDQLQRLLWWNGGVLLELLNAEPRRTSLLAVCCASDEEHDVEFALEPGQL